MDQPPSQAASEVILSQNREGVEVYQATEPIGKRDPFSDFDSSYSYVMWWQQGPCYLRLASLF